MKTTKHVTVNRMTACTNRSSERRSTLFLPSVETQITFYTPVAIFASRPLTLATVSGVLLKFFLIFKMQIITFYLMVHVSVTWPSCKW